MPESNSSVAQKVDIRHKRGDTFKRTLRFWQDEAKTIPTDITGDTFKLNLVNGNNRSNPILSFTMNDGLTITNTQDLNLLKTNEQMKIPATEYNYDLERIKANGEVVTYIEGKFMIDDDRTE